MAVSSCKSAKTASQQLVNSLKKGKGFVEKDASKFVQSSASKKSQLYATVDGGRLHLAVGEHYAGSINHYGIFSIFTDFIGWSIPVTVGDKTYHVDKADFVKWLNVNTPHITATKESLAAFTELHLLEVKATGELGRMRDYLGADKTRKLFEKMVVALVVNKDTEAAKKYASKGANLDGEFYVRDGYPLSLTTLKADLAEDKAIDFKAGRFTVLTYSVDRNNKLFCEYLLKLNANTKVQAQYVQFVKKVTEVSPVTTLVKSEEFTSSDGRKLTRLTLETTSQLMIEDIITPKVDITFNTETNALLKVESTSPVVVEKYNKALKRTTTRYL